MSSFEIIGGRSLSGTITPQGSKNEALQVISACLLSSQKIEIKNVPEITDVLNLIKTQDQLDEEMQAMQQAQAQQSMMDQMGQMAGTPMMDPTKNPALAEQVQPQEELPPEE